MISSVSMVQYVDGLGDFVLYKSGLTKVGIRYVPRARQLEELFLSSFIYILVIIFDIM